MIERSAATLWLLIAFILLAISVRLDAEPVMSVSRGGWVSYGSKDGLHVLTPSGTEAAVLKIGDLDPDSAWPSWSPDGKSLAFYSNAAGTTQLWLWDREARRQRQITSIAGGIDPLMLARLRGFTNTPLKMSWSPDSSRIAFTTRVALPGTSLSDHPAYPTKDQISAGQPIILNTHTPESWTLHGVVSYGRVEDQDYGNRLSDEPVLKNSSSSQIMVVDVSSGRLSQLTHDAMRYYTPDWSPDGKQIAFMSADGEEPSPYIERTDIYVLELATMKVRRITEGNIQKSLPLWSPDGRLLSFYGADITPASIRGPEGIFVVAADGTGQRNVSSSLDRGIMSYAWASDGKGVVVSYWDGLTNPLERFDVATGRRTAVTAKQVVLQPEGQGFAASAAGTLWGQISDPDGPVELYFKPLSRKVRRLRTTAPGRPSDNVRQFEIVHWTNNRGTRLDGMIAYPIGYVAGRKYPLIVDTYGATLFSIGRHGDYAYSDLNFVRAAPYAFIFRPEHRAPHLFAQPAKGAAHDAAAAGKNGIAVMVDDIRTGIAALRDRKLIDDKRICLFGFSNGGLEALQVLTEASEFRCAAVQSPATPDWLNYVFLGYPGDAIRYMYGKAPWVDADPYLRLSPLFEADRIVTPILLAAGDKEAAILPTIEVYNVLRFLKRDVEMLRYPSEGHGFSGKAEADFTTRLSTFFSKYLQPHEIPRSAGPGTP